MTTINLQQFKGKNFRDVYAFIMKNPGTKFNITISRPEPSNMDNYHVQNGLGFMRASYAAELLREVSTDFKYTVPFPDGSDPFEYCIEVNDREKFIDTLYILLCYYNSRYAGLEQDDFSREMPAYYDDLLQQLPHDLVAYELAEIGRKEILVHERINVPDDDSI